MPHLLTQHFTTYPSLAFHIVTILLLAVASTYGVSLEGATRGLVGVGEDAIRKVGHQGTPHEGSRQERQIMG